MKRASIPQAVLPSMRAWPLHSVQASRQIEALALRAAAPLNLMERAGLSVARLAMAVAPGARRVWIAAGPGNNGGDGLVAARHLHEAGMAVRVSLLGDAAHLPADAARALAEACSAGVAVSDDLGDIGHGEQRVDLAIDALLGLGARRAVQGAMAEATARMNGMACPVLSVDLPSGLCAATGNVLGQLAGHQAVRATHTLALLTLKPGLFMAQGRDHAGRIWCDDLGQAIDLASATATLSGPPPLITGPHAQHKGSRGDVIVLGGAAGMGGAATLAARAALTAGAGRVYLARLDGGADPSAGANDLQRPELMWRSPTQALQPSQLASSTLVCGCGGGTAVREWLPAALHHARRLVLDADALNAVAAEPALAAGLKGRAARGLQTVLTPHPLEAARLLNISTAQVQSDRLAHAQALAQRTGCVVVLKGSGSVIAGPDGRLNVNPTGNARLASAGTGDVLAGWLGGTWSAQSTLTPFDAACSAVWWHGRAAEGSHSPLPLLGADLIDAMALQMPQ